ncbi:flagellar basal body P-ring protein FlgI [Benzoatithermus flavus]|uniref:Flagellar P-ring protein n=1 Tax=Benzoatithermus flavus TaxID=3108223 RepID=A0ABU8XVB6_9PROT
MARPDRVRHRRSRAWQHARPSRLAAAVLLAFCLAAPVVEAAPARIKDIAEFQGVRENMLIGYGLVTGLNGTGDNLRSSPFTQQSLVGMLERLGVNVRDQAIRTKNTAAVMVTASLPPFRRQGSRIDVNVSTIGDAKSLLGGQLLPTPLRGANGQVYALAQGPIASSGFGVEGEAAKITVGVPTSGRIPGGAIVELEVPFELKELQSMRIALRNPDFTTAAEVARVINQALGDRVATMVDSGTVEVAVKAKGPDAVANLIARIENLTVEPDTPAQVVIDDKTGTIVIGQDVRISTVAVAHGNLTVVVQENPQVSQPGPLSNGQTVVVPRTQVKVDTGSGKQLAMVPSGATLKELVDSLNALAVGPRDLIAILQAIKNAGALQAELVIQ